MKRLAWLTDIHLNFVDLSEFEQLCETIRYQQPDGVIISGDISEAPRFVSDLAEMEARLERPIFFVLGNHDFYHGSLVDVYNRAAELSGKSTYIRWLTHAGVIPLSNRTCLFGDDGWADARMGNAETTDVMLNDFFLIKELFDLFEGRGIDSEPEVAPVRRAYLQQLGDQAALRARLRIEEALETGFERLIFVTHVPPFRQAAWHRGKVSGDDWLPYFTCRAMGDMLYEVMAGHARQSLTVLCGHTHSEGMIDVLPNLRVYTGGAVYGAPRVQFVLDAM